MAVERLFVAVSIPTAVRDAIRSALPRGIPGRVVHPEHWHLTLRFVGDTDEQGREALVGALRRGELGSAFTIRFSGLGAFPNADRARVLWIGARSDARECEALAARVESAVQAAGFPAESRSFSTHLTLSRLDPPRSVREFVARPVEVDVPLDVRTVTLYQSVLTPQGPRHTPSERFDLVSTP